VTETQLGSDALAVEKNLDVVLAQAKSLPASAFSTAR